jgi:hypothetical protein
VVRSTIPWLVGLAVATVACRTPPTNLEPAGPSDTERDEPELDDLADVAEPTGESGGPALTRDEIRMVVRAKLPQIRACFETGLAHASELGGRVLLRFSIGSDGKAHAIEVVEDELADPSVATCIVEAIPSWQFPRPRDGRSIVITYPFAFSSEQSLRAAGLPRVEGTVKPEALGQVFAARRNELDACIPAGAHGSIGIALNIDDSGAVTRISAYETSLPDDASSCVLRTISSWVFPPAASDDEARVNHDLHW